jgi:hypothetical protein
MFLRRLKNIWKLRKAMTTDEAVRLIIWLGILAAAGIAIGIIARNANAA